MSQTIQPPLMADQTSQRVISIDALRGFDMFLIAGGFQIFSGLFKGINSAFLNTHFKPQLEHVNWQGFSFCDLIMPLFLFIVGAAMPYSFDKRLKGGQGKARIYLHVVMRVVILWVLGAMVQGNLLQYDLSKLQLYSNTLQSIAAGYLFSAIIMLNLPFIGQFAATVLLLLGYWAVLAFVTVPGHPAGTLTPHINPAIYIDKIVLGRFWPQDATYSWVLSSMTFTCTVMMGVFGGYLIKSGKNCKEKLMWLFGSGIACLVVGMVWGRWLPIVKHIWTSSMVLYSGGLCLLLLGFFYLVIDVWQFKKWAFGFIVIGSNAIAAYMATELFDFRKIGDIFVGGLAKYVGNWNEFVRAMAAFAVVWVILYWMYRKKTFIKV